MKNPFANSIKHRYCCW